jgi:hypothetical protein
MEKLNYKLREVVQKAILDKIDPLKNCGTIVVGSLVKQTESTYTLV